MYRKIERFYYNIYNSIDFSRSKMPNQIIIRKHFLKILQIQLLFHRNICRLTCIYWRFEREITRKRVRKLASP